MHIKDLLQAPATLGKVRLSNWLIVIYARLLHIKDVNFLAIEF